MPIEPHLLTLAQWFSPSYPIGAFSYSHGLETAIVQGHIRSKDDLFSWLEQLLHHGAGRSDALFLAAAFHAQTPETIREINATSVAFAPSRERLLESQNQGAAFCTTTAAVWAEPLGDLTYPVAVGHAAQLHGLPLEATSAMFLHAFVANLIGAAQRLALIGQTSGQDLLRALAPTCETVAAQTRDGDLDQLSGTAFLADILAMHHETQYSRMFQT